MKNKQTERAKDVRKAIKHAFKHSDKLHNISVRKDTGTARDWILISGKTPITDIEQWKDLKAKIEDITINAIEKNGHSVPTFYADDGYGTEFSCIDISLCNINT